MSFEKYTKIYDGKDVGTTIRPKGTAATFSFELTPKSNTRYRLFTTGEADVYYRRKNEPDYPKYYRMYSDALDTVHAIRDRYCLNMSCKKNEEHIKRIYKKIAWPPSPGYLGKVTEWETGITVSAKNLKICKDGFLQMRIDVRLKKEGVDPRSVSAPADLTTVIDIPEGTYTGKTLSQTITIPQNTAHVAIFIDGKRYKGECYFEQPRLAASGHNLLPRFEEAITWDNPQYQWASQHLSRKEWPEFRVRLNGKVVFTGEIFERCHRHSEWEVELPRHLMGKKNTVSYELISDYHDPLPYTIFEMGVIEQKAGELAIIATDKVATANGKARVLIRTEKTNLKVNFKSLDGKLSGKTQWLFKETGLHGMLLDCGDATENARFVLEWEGGTAEGCIERIACRTFDNVVTGTGDMVYINQNLTDMEEYLSWFISNNIGDFITIRPIYRWSGTRTVNAEVWKKFRRLMKELNIKYVLMHDGREVEGLCTQPDKEMLKGKNFYGMQLHERDYNHFYGPSYGVSGDIYGEMTSDLNQFAYLEAPEHTTPRFRPNDKLDYINGRKIVGNFYRDFNWSYNRFRKESVASLTHQRGNLDTRHTGPSVMFKYLVEAGFSWIGAETMDSSMEPLLSFLRGTAKENSMSTYGVHHAVQWSTYPHESPARYRRYRLALYVAYMLGVTDINTEEGLWRFENVYAYHHRFDKACLEHTKQQQDFYRYVSTHTRSGEIYTPVAFVHGRDDGTTFFGKNNTWGRIGDTPTTADDSWDLLKIVYPMSKIRATLFCNPCPEDQSRGYYTGTPYGNFDAIPAEGKLSTFKNYRSMIFLGYNRMTEEDSKRFTSYVRCGGRILMSRAHLTSTDVADDIRKGDLKFEDVSLAFCNGTPVFADTTVDGKQTTVCTNAKKPDEVLAYTDDGQPLVCLYKYGKGEIIMFNTKAYPAEEAIRPLYEAEMKRVIEEETAKEPIWAKGNDCVEFAVYNQKDESKHIYFLATDWYRDPEYLREAKLFANDFEYTVTLPFGVLIKAVSNGKVSVWAESEDGEVMSVSDKEITVQGTGKVSFVIARDGKMSKETIDFADASVKTINI
ncbi:MAG: hypothetical protein IKU45_04655 [Clostridia bacterium]|nr:hypothetical protein [Clostridia bacterium]